MFSQYLRKQMLFLLEKEIKIQHLKKRHYFPQVFWL